MKPFKDVWQNSWRLSTQAIGLMITTHGDDRGLVLPPRVAEYQVVLIPLQSSHDEQGHPRLHAETKSIQSTLLSQGVRATADLRDYCSAAWKVYEWIIRGVPLRITLGLEELAGQYVTIHRRDFPHTEGKTDILFSEIPSEIPLLLECIQENLYRKASETFRSRHRHAIDWNDFVHTLRSKVTYSICLVPHCLNKDCERQIEIMSIVPAVEGDNINPTADATRSPVKCLCIPWDQQDGIQESGISNCINPDCDYGAKKWAMFGCK